MTWVATLLSLVGPIAFRLLAYLGIGLATVSGVQIAFDGLKSQMVSSITGLPPTVVLLIGLAGVPQCLGLVWGAFNARLLLWVAVSSTKWVSTK